MPPRPNPLRFACCALAVSLVSNSAFAASPDPQTQPTQQPPPDPNAPPPGNVVVVPNGPVPGQEQLRTGLLIQGRGGVGFSLINVGGERRAMGPWGGAVVGYQTSSGFSVVGLLGARYHVGGNSYGLFNAELMGLARYTAFPFLRFHPFGEFGVGLTMVGVSGNDYAPTAMAFNFAFALTVGLGLEVDLTANWSLDIGLRGDVAGDSRNRSTMTGPSAPEFFLTPFVGVTYYQ